MTARPWSHWLAVAGLTVLTAIILWRWEGWLRLAVLPPLILLLTGFRPPQRWGGWAAVVMVPYACIAVMGLLISTNSGWPGILLATSSVLVFFTGLDSVRRSGVSLRR